MRDDAVDTRERMLETALDLIAERSYEGVSLQMIADAVGVTKAAVYYHFNTKAELLDAILHRLFANVPAIPDPRVMTSRRSRVLWLVDQILASLTTDRRIASVVSTDLVIRTHPTFIALVASTSEQVITAVFGDQPTVSERAAFHLATAAVHTLPELQYLGNDELIEALRPVLHRTLGIPAPARSKPSTLPEAPGRARRRG